MAKYLLVVPSNATAGQEDDYNHWYDTEHLGDLEAIPGVIAGTRFEIAATSPNQPAQPYVALYEIEAEDPMQVIAEIGKRAQTGEMQISPALDVNSTQMWLYKAR
jgi:hypothetical protein